MSEIRESRIRPWTRRILELVDSGVTERTEVIRQTIPFVPQGHAYRTRERDLERLRHRTSVAYEERIRNGETPHHGPFGPRAVDPIDCHEVGARMVIRHTILKLIRGGHLVLADGHLVRPSTNGENR